MRVTTSASDISSLEIDRYLENTAASTLYHRAAWTSVIEECFGHRTYYLVCRDDDGAARGVLPLVHMKSRLFGNFLVSMPFFNYGGVCADSDIFRSRLIEEAVRIANDVGASHIEFRQEEPLCNSFPVKTAKVSMRLALPASAEELMHSFPSKLRSQIRRPRKEGMSARIGRIDELDSFYEVFAFNMRRLGTPVLPRHFFATIFKYFPGDTWICSVYKDRIPVASGFLIGFKDRLEIPWASAREDYNRYSPNMLLYWSCLEFACGRGYRVYDFGRSTAGEKTYKFKEQWGARPLQLHWHYWLGDGGSIPDLSPKNPRYRLGDRNLETAAAGRYEYPGASNRQEVFRENPSVRFLLPLRRFPSATSCADCTGCSIGV